MAKRRAHRTPALPLTPAQQQRADVYARGGLAAERRRGYTDLDQLDRKASAAKAMLAHSVLLDTQSTKDESVSEASATPPPDTIGEVRRDNWESGGALMNKSDIPNEHIAAMRAKLESADPKKR